MGLFSRKTEMVRESDALPGRSPPLRVPERHHVNGERIQPPFAAGLAQAVFGLGCFWGAERLFWKLPGVVSTAVGLCRRLHAESDLRGSLLGTHRPHRGRAGGLRPRAHDLRRPAAARSGRRTTRPRECARATTSGTQYRSAIYVTSAEQLAAANASKRAYQARLAAAGLGTITTEIRTAPPFFYAEDYHQQYLAKNPNGYCGLAGTGVSCPVGTGTAAA